jgi:hypothetical protein
MVAVWPYRIDCTFTPVMTGGNPSDPPHPFSNDATDKPTTPNTDLIRDIETISTLKNEWNTTLVCT